MPVLMLALSLEGLRRTGTHKARVGNGTRLYALQSENRGQVILRHTDSPAYRCFLPDLAGFTRFHCTGPSPFRLSVMIPEY